MPANKALCLPRRSAFACEIFADFGDSNEICDEIVHKQNVACQFINY